MDKCAKTLTQISNFCSTTVSTSVISDYISAISKIVLDGIELTICFLAIGWPSQLPAKKAKNGAQYSEFKASLRSFLSTLRDSTNSLKESLNILKNRCENDSNNQSSFVVSSELIDVVDIAVSHSSIVQKKLKNSWLLSVSNLTEELDCVTKCLQQIKF
eukprot:c8194_g1_i1.p1 GENE.c8194_g1_i1~~c8194_g1_i1.p1  ORF type:complete len:159 (+),score=52.76 c8194_g1_i1:56-532(+)